MEASPPVPTYHPPYQHTADAHRRSAQTFFAPVAILILLLTLIFSFQYYGSEDWIFGIVIAIGGLCVIALVLFLAIHQERASARPMDRVWSYDRTSLVLGMMVMAIGSVLLMYGGSTSPPLLVGLLSILGLMFLIAGLFWTIVALR